MTNNLRAFLAMIAWCEVGTDAASGYATLYGGGKFTSFADHPRKAVTAGRYTSTAAGRYQALAGTWDDFCRAKGKHDFSPASQDEFCVWCITRRGALADVEAGRIEQAIAKCGREWASLPGSPYGQPVRTLAWCLQKYREAGGQIGSPVSSRLPEEYPAVQPTTQPESPKMGATLLAGLIPSILSLFSDRAQAAISKATGASPEVAQKFTADIAKQIEVVSGVAVDSPAAAMKAAAEIASDPVKVAALEQHATAFVLTEIGGGIKAAQDEYAAINKDYDDDVWWRIPAKFLFNPIHWVTGVFLYWVTMFIPPLTKTIEGMSKEASLGLIVSILAVIAVVSGRWMGTYNKSKDE